MRLARTERAGQESGPTLSVLQRGGDEIERLVERFDQSWRDHVGVDSGGDVVGRYTLRQTEDVIVGPGPLRDID